MPISLELGDITTTEADAIVNAANSHLVIGGGVCGAIHRVGGSAIVQESAAWVNEHGLVPPGEAAITTAGELPARYVVHAVGPMWHGGAEGEPEQLASAYRAAIEIADSRGLRTIAFPSISTGIFGYPVDLAAPVAIEAVRDALSRTRVTSDVIFVLYDQATYDAYEDALDQREE
jgi:O-acetyl-ADP-ribose deacetylase (regulator of RNase III)